MLLASLSGSITHAVGNPRRLRGLRPARARGGRSGRERARHALRRRARGRRLRRRLRARLRHRRPFARVGIRRRRPRGHARQSRRRGDRLVDRRARRPRASSSAGVASSTSRRRSSTGRSAGSSATTTGRVPIGLATPLARSFVAIPAGIVRVPLAKFLGLALLGSAAFCFGLGAARLGARNRVHARPPRARVRRLRRRCRHRGSRGVSPLPLGYSEPTPCLRYR